VPATLNQRQQPTLQGPSAGQWPTRSFLGLFLIPWLALILLCLTCSPGLAGPATTTTVRSEPNPSGFQHPVTLKAVVEGFDAAFPTGIVAFTEDGALIVRVVA
jgi:hypothetical protein